MRYIQIYPTLPLYINFGPHLNRPEYQSSKVEHTSKLQKSKLRWFRPFASILAILSVTACFLQDCHLLILQKKSCSWGAHVWKKKYWYKLQGFFEKMGRLALYRDFKKFLMAFFGQGYTNTGLERILTTKWF